MPPKLRETIVRILFGLRRDQRKIRLCLLQLHSLLVNGDNQNADQNFLGLELQATEQLKQDLGEQKRV